MTPPTLLEVRVHEVTDLAVGVKSLELEAVDGQALPLAIAGQYINIDLDQGIRRSYSLLDQTHESPKTYRVAVALAEDSKGGSRAVHQNIVAGDRLRITPPDGSFVLAEGAPHHVFIAGGIGITPIHAMIRRLEAVAGSWELHYASRSRDRAAFLADFLAMRPHSDSVHIYISSETGGRSLRMADIVEAAAQGTHLYCCGPASLIDDFLAASRDLLPDTVHMERFSSEIEAAQGGFRVELAKSGMILEVQEEESILDAVLDAGIEIPFSCEEGICGSCRTGVLKGKPDHRDSVLTATEREAGNTMMICCSGSKGELLVLDI